MSKRPGFLVAFWGLMGERQAREEDLRARREELVTGRANGDVQTFSMRHLNLAPVVVVAGGRSRGAQECCEATLEVYGTNRKSRMWCFGWAWPFMGWFEEDVPTSMNLHKLSTPCLEQDFFLDLHGMYCRGILGRVVVENFPQIPTFRAVADGIGRTPRHFLKDKDMPWACHITTTAGLNELS